MTAIAGAACSSRVLFGCREVGGDRASLAQYGGLRPVESMQLARTGRRSASKSRAVRAMVSQTVSAPKREKDPKKRVVITGMGLVSVFGSGIDTFYDKLLEEESGISLIDRLRSDNEIFEHLRLSDGQNKNWSPGGNSMGGLTAFINGIESLVQKGYKKMSPFFIPYSITNMGSALLAIDTGLMGPNNSISTACATANCCFYLAANHIRRGEAGIMVAGGTEAAVIPTGIMESLEHAMKRGANIIAEYLGVSTCIAKSLEDAGVSPEEDYVAGLISDSQVNYVNAHATSTLAGDLAEVNAIMKVFKNTSEIKMNGTKSMIGHGLGAAGALEAIATIKAINTGWLHPTINQDNIEPDVTIDTVPNVKKQHEVNVGISNSFGFGGHNSAVVFAPFTA
uniref:beta-ketoacyl-[acyl-carrier-protein] synthase I n=1 Tax=Salix viminalis TaxID=40686 RepID=A0A6N2M7B7_SALVM